MLIPDAGEPSSQTPRPASESRALKSPALAAEKRAGADESCSSVGDDSRNSTSASASASANRPGASSQQQAGESTGLRAVSVSSLSASVAGAGGGKSLDSSGAGSAGGGGGGGAAGQQPDCIYSLTAMQQAGSSLASSLRPSSSYQLAYLHKVDSPNLFNCHQLSLPLNLSSLLEHCPLFRVDSLPFFMPAPANKPHVRILNACSLQVSGFSKYSTLVCKLTKSSTNVLKCTRII